jgi:hypothetical protein
MTTLRAAIRWGARFGAVWAATIAGVAPAAEDSSLTPATPPVSATNLPLRQVGPGQFELGKVRLDKRQRTVSFPAVVNLTEGIIEYLLVTEAGKTHESLLRTDVAPYQIHVAMLLLDARGAGTNDFPEESAKPLPGDKVTVEVSWSAGGRDKRRRAEEFILDRSRKSAMTKGAWVYTGSRLVEGAFAAQLDGSLISLITDASALVNNPRPRRDDDENWLARPGILPPLETPVQVTLRLGSVKPAP